MMKPVTTFVTIYELAQRTGLSCEWLRKEAKAGRIPHLKNGRAMMFNVESVEQSLLKQASDNCKPIEKPDQHPDDLER